MKYDHIGIPMKTRREEMIYIPEFKVWASSYEKDPYRRECLFFEKEAPFPILIQTMPHVCFEVGDIEKMIEGKKILFPISLHIDCKFGFIEHEGLPVEFIQYI